MAYISVLYIILLSAKGAYVKSIANAYAMLNGGAWSKGKHNSLSLRVIVFIASYLETQTNYRSYMRHSANNKVAYLPLIITPPIITPPPGASLTG